MPEWWAHPDYVDHAEQVLAGCPDSWDGDDSQESIIERYVHHLRDEVMRLGGCLRPFCFWADGEDCDHGYLTEPAPPRCPPACSEMHTFEPGCLAYVAVPDAGGDLMAQAETDGTELPVGLRWCPECNGEGTIVTMDASPDMNEHERPCTYPGCEEGRGMVVDQRAGDSRD